MRMLRLIGVRGAAPMLSFFIGPLFGLDLNTCLLLGLAEGIMGSFVLTLVAERYIFPANLD